jgi:hypothetical protein
MLTMSKHSLCDVLSKAWIVVSRYVSPFLQVTKALRESTGIDLLCFLDLGTRRGEGSASHHGRFTPVPTVQKVGVGPRAGLDRCGKSRPHRDSILGPSSP